MKRSIAFAAGWVVAAVLAAPALAQTGNLVPNGRFDVADGVTGWHVGFPQYSSLVFDPNEDADLCPGSGSAWATSDPAIDFGSATFSVCLGAVTVGQPYWIGGEVLFSSSAVVGRANLTLNFMTGPDCTGSVDGGQFAGYALSTVAGWQRLAAGPAIPGVTVQSAVMHLFLIQIVGAEPAIEARFDEIRVTLTDWIFADDLEIGDSCRWDSIFP